jgi:hypothetical protein
MVDTSVGLSVGFSMTISLGKKVGSSVGIMGEVVKSPFEGSADDVLKSVGR